MFKNKSFIIEIIVALVLCFYLSLNEVILPPGPDANLYNGISENLLSSVGYVDNIRNDFILPSVGHPLLLATLKFFGMTDGNFISALLYFITLFSSYLLGLYYGLKFYLRIILVLITSTIMPDSLMWGVELSIGTSVILFWIALINLYHKNTQKAAIIFGVAIAVNILIRPIIQPLYYVCIPLVIVGYFIFKKKSKNVVVAFIVSAVLYFGFKSYSEIKYGDSRMVTGTYGEIPLYCAFNNYIDLDKIYYSSRWRQISDSLFIEGTAPFKLTTTWEDRALTLKSHVKDFIVEHPDKAWKGFVWRLGKYSIDQDTKHGTTLFFLWIITLIFFIVKSVQSFDDWLFKLAIVGMPIYILLITSMFPYVGVRYLLTSGLYYLFSMIAMLMYLDKKQLITSK
jgi:hypothetical protein